MSSKRSDTIKIRPIRSADCQAVSKLWSDARLISGMTDQLPSIRTRLRRDRELFLGAWSGSRLVGTLIAGWDGWRGSMARLAVDSAYRRQRIAQRLVEIAEARLHKLGARRIGCLVLSDNKLGARFWRSAGYHREVKMHRFVKNLRT